MDYSEVSVGDSIQFKCETTWGSGTWKQAEIEEILKDTLGRLWLKTTNGDFLFKEKIRPLVRKEQLKYIFMSLNKGLYEEKTLGAKITIGNKFIVIEKKGIEITIPMNAEFEIIESEE